VSVIGKKKKKVYVLHSRVFFFFLEKGA